jgi:hypothetical protein
MSAYAIIVIHRTLVNMAIIPASGYYLANGIPYSSNRTYSRLKSACKIQGQAYESVA